MLSSKLCSVQSFNACGTVSGRSEVSSASECNGKLVPSHQTGRYRQVRYFTMSASLQICAIVVSVIASCIPSAQGAVMSGQLSGPGAPLDSGHYNGITGNDGPHSVSHQLCRLLNRIESDPWTDISDQYVSGKRHGGLVGLLARFQSQCTRNTARKRMYPSISQMFPGNGDMTPRQPQKRTEYAYRSPTSKKSDDVGSSMLVQENPGVWPAYLPLDLTSLDKRRWGDPINACIQSNCSTLSGNNRIQCIVQKCQRKRDPNF